MAEFQLDRRSLLRDPSKQKRKYGRLDVRIPAEFQIESSGARYEANLLNLGAGGVGMTAKTPLKPGDRIQMTFPLEEEKIDAIMVVSRANGNSFGAVFENPEDPVILALQSYIERRFFLR